MVVWLLLLHVGRRAVRCQKDRSTARCDRRMAPLCSHYFSVHFDRSVSDSLCFRIIGLMIAFSRRELVVPVQAPMQVCDFSWNHMHSITLVGSAIRIAPRVHRAITSGKGRCALSSIMHRALAINKALSPATRC